MTKTIKRTVCVKLDVGTHADALALTMRTFNEAATWIAGVCWSEGITNSMTLHHRVYKETRQRYGLGSQLAECARAKAMEAIKAVRKLGSTTCPTFGPRGAVRYDEHTYRLMSLDRVSLATLAGRVQCQMLPGGRQRALLMDLAWHVGGADLVYRNGTYYLHIVQTCEAPGTMDDGDMLGVDLVYKAAAVGVPVVFVDPAYTSQACSGCGHCERANRRSQGVFLCRSCGLLINADWNGALNIASRAAANRPIVPDALPAKPWVWKTHGAERRQGQATGL